MVTANSCIRAIAYYCPVAALTVTVLSASAPAAAQFYPSKPVRVVVPYGAGGSVDTLARLLGQQITEAWRQQIVVEARPGAGGLIGTEIVAKSPADGYTVMMAVAASTMAISVYTKVPYDLLRDFTALGLVGYTPHITVVHPSLPAMTLQELIKLAKARPKEIYFSSSGNGVGSHLAVELFKTMAKVEVTHVPYKGAPSAVQALLSGEVSLMIVNLVSALPHVKSGKFRALGIGEAKRTPLLPNVPTMAEAGLKGYEFIEWYGMIAPAGTPRDVIAKWNAEINRIVATSEFRDRLAALGVTPRTGTADEFNAYLAAEVERYAKIVKEAKVKVD